MLDIKKGVWAKEFIKELEIDINKLPRLYRSHDLAGGLRKEAADMLLFTLFDGRANSPLG